MEDAKGREAILAQEQQSKVVSKLHGLLRPFLLRRIKADVEGSLPPKQEIIMWAPMSKLQHELNTHLRDNTLHVRTPCVHSPFIYSLFLCICRDLSLHLRKAEKQCIRDGKCIGDCTCMLALT